MTDNRDELIEAAKRAISDYDIAKARRVSVPPDRLAILLAEFVAVFEQAHTPTDDEREAGYRAVHASGLISDDVTANARLWRAVEAYRIGAEASRRPAQSEPTVFANGSER